MSGISKFLRPRSYPTYILILIMSHFEKLSGKHWTIPIYFRDVQGRPTEPLRIRWSSSDAQVFKEVFVDQQYSLPQSRKPAETILDLGANYGASGYYFGLMCPRAKVISLEPSPANLEILRRNSRAFPDRWIIDSRAILASERVATFFWSSWHSSGSCSPAVGKARLSNHHRPEAKTARRPCEVTGIDVNGLLREHGIDHISICKMDVEGAEEEVINVDSDVTWLSRLGMLMIEIHDKYFNSSQLRALLVEQGFILREKRGWEARTELYVRE